jgi:signal transduction histidine kinase
LFSSHTYAKQPPAHIDSDNFDDAKLLEKTPIPGVKPDAPINILILSSYPPTIPWAKTIHNAFVQESQANEKPVNLIFETLYAEPDILQLSTAQYFAIIDQKYQNLPIHGIVAESFMARELYLQEFARSAKFANVPVVIREVGLAQGFMANTNVGVTNSSESKLLIENVNLMLQQRPKMRNMYVLANMLGSGVIYLDELTTYLATHHPHVTLSTIPFETLEGLRQTVAALPENDVLVYLPTYYSHLGKTYSPQELLGMFSSASSVPIYSFWSTFMGHGVANGFLLEPEVIGYNIIEMLLAKIETGEFLPELELGRWMGDYELQEEFNLTLPADVRDATIVNQPRSIFQDYPLEMTGVGLGLSILTIMFIVFRQIKLTDAYNQARASELRSAEYAKKVEALSNTKNKFLASISHELRTPINGIVGATTVLSDSEQNELQRKYTKIIQYCSDSLLNTVNDLLDVIKLQSQQFTLSPQPFDFNQLVEQSVEYARVISRDTDLVIHTEKGTIDALWVKGDLHRIRQIVNNLINNAIKFTHGGEVSLFFMIKMCTQGQLHLYITVRDTGCGIAEGDHHKLFKPFTQLNLDYLEKNVGTGLGLSICHELLQVMHGQIKFVSEVAQGSQFSVCIPLEEVSILERQALLMAQQPPNIQGCRILIVEDNQINQTVLQQQLQDWLCKFIFVNDGVECLNCLNQVPAKMQIILMDLQMPNMNGYEAARRIRAGECGEQYKHIPIIALTAHVELDKELQQSAQFNAVVHKPVDVEGLVREIQRLT